MLGSWCITPRNPRRCAALLMMSTWIVWLMWLLPGFSTDGKICLHSRIPINTCWRKDRNRKSPFGRHHRWWGLPGLSTNGETWPSVAFQLINIERMMNIENPHLANTSVNIVSGKNHHWMLKVVPKIWWETRFLYNLELSLYVILINYKERKQ